jgi:tetratricopeptide (TPR) repeat protein
VDLARLSTDRDRLQEAEAYLRKAFLLDPDNALAHEVEGQLSIKLGRQAVLQGETARARELFERAEAASLRALELSDKMKWAHINAATSLVERSRLLAQPDPSLLVRAIEQYGRELERWGTPPARGEERDTYYAALANTCDAQIELGRLAEALGTCSRVTAVFPDDAVGFYNLAGVYGLLGRGDEALVALERDLELGDTGWEYLAADKWFVGLHGHPRFTEILDEMKRRSTAEAGG